MHVFKPVGYTGLAGFALSALRVPWVLDVDDWEGRGGWADVNAYTPAQRASITLMEALLPRMARGVTAASRTLEARAWDMGLARNCVHLLAERCMAREVRRVGTAEVMIRQSSGNAGLAASQPSCSTRGFDVFPVAWPLTVLRT